MFDIYAYWKLWGSFFLFGVFLGIIFKILQFGIELNRRVDGVDYIIKVSGHNILCKIVQI